MGANDVVLQHVEAFNSRRRDSEPWASDGELVAPGATIKGRDNVLGFLGVFQEAFPDLRLEIKRMITEGSIVAAEGIFSGTHTGVLRTPAGDIPATGKSVAVRWASQYEVHDSELLSENLYFDQMDLMGQLGLMP